MISMASCNELSNMNDKDIPLTCRYFQEGWGLGKMDNVFHVIPVNELDQHSPTIKCDCQPKMEIVKVHNEETETYEEHYFVLHNSYLLKQIKKANSN